MNRAILVAAGALGASVPLAAQQTTATWRVGGSAASAYSMTTVGSALDRTGATLTLRSDTAAPTAFGTITGVIAADSFRLRRVRVVADVDAKAVTGGASPWLRVDGPDGMIALDNGTDQALAGTTSGHREISIYVPANATTLVFGLLVRGSGEATARGLRLEARPAPAANAPLAASAQRELDSAIALVRARSLWRDTVTWSAVEPDVRAMAAGAETAEDVHPAIRALLARLGDHHSFLMKPSGARQFQAGGAQNPRPTIRALPDAVGYVSVPAYSGAESTAMTAYAKGMQDSLAAVLPAIGCRWVVDLRNNGGGNMWPMLGGLRPFLGEVGLGSFVSAAGSAPLWHAGDAVNVQPPPALAALESAYVAVLTGPHTASSGEAVTISFRGRPRTRSFGLATAGLSTANAGLTLPDSSMIFLTVSVEADRTGRRYGEKIDPDEIIAVVPSDKTDQQLARAVAWLTSQPACTSR